MAVDLLPPPTAERAAGDTSRFTDWRDRFAALCGQVLILGGFWCLVSLALRPVRGVHIVDRLFGLLNLPVGPSLFSMVLLFVIGGAIRRRIRIALWLLLAFQAFAAVYLILVGVIVITGRASNSVRLGPAITVEFAVNAVLTIALVILLWRSREAFSSHLEPAARWQALLVIVVGLAASIAVTVLLTLSFPDHLDTASRRVVWAVRTAVGVEPDTDDPGWNHQHGHHWIAAVAGLMSAIALVAGALVFLKSRRAKTYLTAQDELAVRGLLLHHGERDSLGYFATRHDKSVIFSPQQNAALTYRILGNVSLASADPIGAVSAWPGVITAWLTEAREFGWFPAVLSASEEGAQAYVAAGLKALPIGDEAVIVVDEFSLEGPRMQPVRRAVHRVERAGYVITVARHNELSTEQLAELDLKAEEWRGDETERGFSMALGRLGEPADGECVAVLAHDADGRLRGLLSMVPWGQRGLSLDLMRRDRDSENGLVEAMVAGLVTACRDDLGVRQVSLNFAMFRGIFSAAERVGAGPLVRLTSRVLTFASRFWQIESLYRSNARYLPRWDRRYLCFDSSLTLTRVALAAGVAEGFLPAIGRGRQRSGDPDVVFEGRELPFADAVGEQRRTIRRAARPVRRLSEQQRVRLDKIAVLREAGREAYPVSVPRSCELSEVRARHEGLAAGAATGEQVSVVGRVRAIRDFGGLVFVVIADGLCSLQAILTATSLTAAAAGGDGTAELDLLRGTLDLGDYLAVTGEVVASQHGELSVLAGSWQLAAKCLRPLPDAHAGFADPDARVRSRHVDLIVNADSMKLLLDRSVAVSEIRQAFSRRAFVEVETPMLQSVHGGANARPFVTHINAYDATLYLRIAPELFLKRLCVGGMPRIFELNRNFRNEGADATHNPEFTSVEAYQAYADYLSMAQLTRDLILEVATAVHGSPVALRPGPDGALAPFDLAGEWRSVTVHQAVSEAVGELVTADTTTSELIRICRERQVKVPVEPTPGGLVVELYEALVERQTVAPTFYLDFPIETSPLTRVHRVDPRLSERWDLVAFGAEIGTAYSELIDPVDQRARLTEQSLRAAAGDPEAMQVDEAFLSALEYAMPPTGGLGLGVDRLVMMLTGASIRQTLAFPFVRPAGR